MCSTDHHDPTFNAGLKSKQRLAGMLLSLRLDTVSVRASFLNQRDVRGYLKVGRPSHKREITTRVTRICRTPRSDTATTACTEALPSWYNSRSQESYGSLRSPSKNHPERILVVRYGNGLAGVLTGPSQRKHLLASKTIAGGASAIIPESIIVQQAVSYTPKRRPVEV